MKTFDYKCKCGKQVEKLVKDQNEVVTCECGKAMERQSVFSLRLNGFRNGSS